MGSLDPNACVQQGGNSFELERCNDGPCPSWGNWSGWSGCSENCGGGVRSRSRRCIKSIGDQLYQRPYRECSGSNTDEELCNQTSCERKIIYWENELSHGKWVSVNEGKLTDGDTMFNRCASYCLSVDGCLGMAVTYFQPEEDRVDEKCYINKSPYTRGPVCWGSRCHSSLQFQSLKFGVFKDYYETNPEFLPTDDPKDEIEVKLNDADGQCNVIQVGRGPTTNGLDDGFGLTRFRETNGIVFESDDDKNVVHEDGEADCGKRCFLKAGCKAFYTNQISNTCTMIFNAPTSERESGWSGVRNGGILTDICSNIAFKDQIERRSRFNCIFFSPDQSDEVLQEVLDRNSVGANALNTWTHEVVDENEDPYMVQSRYIHVTFPDNDGTDERYRAVYFNIETHIRTGRVVPDRNPRTLDSTERTRRESVRVGELTEEVDMENHKQTAKEANNVQTEASQEYSLEAVIAAAIAGEKAATDFIIGGGLDMPTGLSVAATGPIELVEFVRKTDDGSIAAYCSSESDCICGRGFIDNGEGCVEMTEDQAATTQAPTTQTTSYSNVLEYLPLLIEKMTDVFLENRPGTGRSHLSSKWNKLSQKFNKKYSNLVKRGCPFPTGLENTVNFDSVNACRVSLSSRLKKK